MRRSQLLKVLVLALVGFSACAPTKGQSYIYATGNPSFGVNIPVENGFINVTNGNLHLELSLASHKQRGALTLDEKLVYDSRFGGSSIMEDTIGFPLTYPIRRQDGASSQGTRQVISASHRSHISRHVGAAGTMRRQPTDIRGLIRPGHHMYSVVSGGTPIRTVPKRHRLLSR